MATRRSRAVGAIDAGAARLLKTTEESLQPALRWFVRGRPGDVGAAVQKGRGPGILRGARFCGHGIGVEMHEDPQVPNFGEAGRGMKLKRAW